MESKELETIKFQPAFDLRQDGIYKIEDFDVLYDRQFVQAMYFAILRRAPDPTGEANYLGSLRAGENKAKLLCIFLHSEEAKKHHTEVKGLKGRMRLIRILEIPLIGRVIAALFFLLNINEHMRDLRVIENHMIRLAEETQSKNDSSYRKLISMIRQRF
jgi:hypothetical protein